VAGVMRLTPIGMLFIFAAMMVMGILLYHLSLNTPSSLLMLNHYEQHCYSYVVNGASEDEAGIRGR